MIFFLRWNFIKVIKIANMIETKISIETCLKYCLSILLVNLERMCERRNESIRYSFVFRVLDK